MTEPTGYTALDLIGFTDKGDYDASTAYVQNDLVHYDNSIWRCLVDDTTGQTPVEGTYWTIFVESENAASGVTYDGTSSELSATNVQDAIDEVVDEKADSTIISDAYDSTATYAVGDYFIYDNVLYYVDVACTGITPPNTNYYTATSVSSEISNTWTLIGTSTGTQPVNISSDTSNCYWVEVANGNDTTIRFEFNIPRAALTSSTIQYRTGCATASANLAGAIIGASLNSIAMVLVQGVNSNGSWNSTNTSIMRVFGM